MNAAPAPPDCITLVNVLTVPPANHDLLLALLQRNIDDVIRTLDGWISTTLIAAQDRSKVIIHSQWRDIAAVEAMRADAAMRRYFPQIVALATFDSIAGHVVHARHA